MRGYRPKYVPSPGALLMVGSLAGAVYGPSALSDGWREKVHGWPGIRAADLEEMVKAVERSRTPDGSEVFETSNLQIEPGACD